MRNELQGLRGIVRRRTGLAHEDLHGCTTVARDERLTASVPIMSAAASTIGQRHVSNTLLLAIVSAFAATSCGPRLQLPSLSSPPPAALGPEDSGASLARELAPVLYLQADESFPLLRVVAVVHPARPIIAYHLLWRDDAHGAWVPFTRPSDQEVVWVGYDSTRAPTDLWTYWHGAVLHTAWPKQQVLVDVQWGKHGSMPRATIVSTLPRFRSLESFYLLTWGGFLDLWIGRLSRRGPWCFCGGWQRYLSFTRPLSLAGRIDVVVRAEDPTATLRSVFGADYSGKRNWPAAAPNESSSMSDRKN